MCVDLKNKKRSIKMFKKTVVCLLMLMMLLGFAGITQAKSVEFWVGADPRETAFWTRIFTEWDETHPDLKIDWRPAPTGKSGEEVLLTAIATGTGPDLSTGIFAGFAFQLMENDILVPFNKFEGFEELLEARSMTNIVKKAWGYKGDYYVLPMYTNPIAFWWNKDVLDELGIDVPRTYSDVLKLAALYNDPKSGKYTLYTRFTPSWWHRWQDFCAHYYAATGGKPYWDDQKVYFNDENGLKYMEFINTMFRKEYSPLEDIQDAIQKGNVIGGINKGPWSIKPTREKYPDFNYVIAPPLVPDSFPLDKPIYTFADTKGISMLTKDMEKQEVIWEFLKWLFSDSKHDVIWLEETTMLPSREDVTTNPVFSDFLGNHPKLAEYAKLLPYAIPPPLNAKTAELQTAFNELVWEPIAYGKKSPKEALADAEVALNKILQR